MENTPRPIDYTAPDAPDPRLVTDEPSDGESNIAHMMLGTGDLIVGVETLARRHGWNTPAMFEQLASHELTLISRDGKLYACVEVDPTLSGFTDAPAKGGE